MMPSTPEFARSAEGRLSADDADFADEQEK